MMKHGKTFAFMVCLLMASAPLFADSYSVEVLLEGYLKNDLSLKQLSTSLEKQQLNSQITQLNNGFDIQISTGTITIRPGSEGSSFSFRPSATASIPQASNLGLSVGSSVSVKNDDASVSDTSISVSADIISSSVAERSVTLQKSERQVLEAERKLSNGYLTAEKQFYNELKSLYNAASSVISAEKSLSEDRISFEQIVAQGYASTSSKYRTAYMKVLSDERSVETANRELERKVSVFAAKCGVEYTSGTAMNFLPTEIPQVEAVDVLSFAKENYTELESALWTQYINEASRNASSDITLSASAGFTFDNSQTKSNSLDASAKFSWSNSLSVTGGVSLPVGAENASPVITMGITVNPFGFKKTDLQNQVTELNALQEEYDIQSAEKNYETAVVNQQSSLSDILWSRQTNAESYQLYSELARDTAEWYAQGIVSKSEYDAALVNEENYRLKCLMNDIDLIIYNNETELLFCRDGE